MNGFLVDLGTAYAKVKELPSGRTWIQPVRQAWAELEPHRVLAATGHGASRLVETPVNELLALAAGARGLLQQEDFTVVDCGARDLKCVQFRTGRPIRMDWNTECGSFTGQTIELLRNHFGLVDQEIEPPARALVVTCGVLGMVRLFDLVAEGVNPGEAYAAFVAGVARNVLRFAGESEVLHLSGGLCEHPVFLRSLADHSVEPLGRFVLLEGLQRLLEQGLRGGEPLPSDPGP